MRFMMMMKADDQFEAGAAPNPELDAAIGEYTEKMMKAGVVLQVGGLAPSSQSARVYASGGELKVIDGPFAETKELIGGFAICQADSLAEAIQQAKDFMKLHTTILGTSYEGQCEIRPLFGPEDFANGTQ